MGESIQKENKMGTMPVNRLLVTMAAPMMLAMLVQALYNIVDSIFVGRICEDALTAVSLAFPIQTLLIAFGTGTGVGMNAILSRSLGCHDRATAEKAARTGVFLTLVSYVIFVLVGLFLARPFFVSQTMGQANQDQIVQYGVDYLKICCVLSIGIFIELVFERILQACGYTFYTMITQMCGAIINIVLDPILIFGLLGFPAMGTTGAAVATVIGQIVSGILAFVINRKKNQEVTVSLRKIRPEGRMIAEIYRVGVPSILMQAIGSVMYYGMNLILMPFTSTASAVFGVYFKLQSFVFMPVFGMNNSVVPIIAYNYGAGKRSRMIKTIKLGIFYAVCIMLLGLAVFQLLPDKLLLLFNATDHMLDIGVPALRIMSLAFVFAGACILCGTVFQALGNGIYSLFVSVLRQLIVLLPAAFLLSKVVGLSAVWWAFPIAEIASIITSGLLMARIYRKVISQVPDNV